VEVFKEPMASIYENAGCESEVGRPESVCFMVVQLLSRDESQLLSENFVFLTKFISVKGFGAKIDLKVFFYITPYVLN
jgi:hypothetical protein